MVSANCATSMRRRPRLRACCSTFSPYSIVRTCTTSAVRPRSVELSSAASVCSIDVACHTASDSDESAIDDVVEGGNVIGARDIVRV